MIAAKNEAIVRKMFRDSIELGDIDAVIETHDPDWAYHNPALAEMPDLPRGKEGMAISMTGSSWSSNLACHPGY